MLSVRLPFPLHSISPPLASCSARLGSALLLLLLLADRRGSLINPRCGCRASHTVSTFFCHSQLFSLTFPKHSPLPLSLFLPLSPLLPLPISSALLLSSATLLLQLKHRVLKPVGAKCLSMCALYFNYSEVLLRVEIRLHICKVRAFCLFLLL